MSHYDYDLFVIGGGSGGVRAARMSAQMGARVALCEERYLGGTCVNVGCVPKKLLYYGAHFGHELEHAAGFGWTVEGKRFDWRQLIENKDTEIARLNEVYGRLLDNAGVETLHGRGTLVDAHTVEVNGHRHTAEHILIATGSWPYIPDVPGREHGITSNEAFYLERLPERILIGGGGYIAVEFAGIFNGMGADVTQVYRGPLFLRGFDDDVRGHLAGEMRKKGVHLHFNANITGIEKAGGALLAHLSDGSRVETDLVMFATGRTPLTKGLGLESAGVQTDEAGAVVVDEHMRTNVPSVYALGDVINRVALTPVAIAEGMTLSHNLFGQGEPRTMDYSNVPSAVFSDPNVGAVGLTEAEARARLGRVRIYKTGFRHMKHTLTGSDERTLMKLIVDDATDRVVGCHMVGDEAGEIVQGLAVALQAGATKATFDATVGIHPTAAEEWVTLRTPEPEPAAAAAGD